jgi:hypothetical protein
MKHLTTHVPVKARQTAYRLGDDPERMERRLFDEDGWYELYDESGIPLGELLSSEEYNECGELSNLEFDSWILLFKVLNAPNCAARLLDIKENGL